MSNTPNSRSRPQQQQHGGHDLQAGSDAATTPQGVAADEFATQWPHGFGCPCPTCIYYAAGGMFMGEYNTPFALVQQQFANPWSGMQGMPFLPGAVGMQGGYSSQQQHRPNNRAGSNSNGRHQPAEHLLPLNFEATGQRSAAGCSPTSATSGEMNLPTPLRRLDFASDDAVEDAVMAQEDLQAFCCTPRGRDFALSALANDAAASKRLVAELLPNFVNLACDATCIHVLRAMLDRLEADGVTTVLRAYADGDFRDTLNLATTSRNTRKLLECLLNHRESPHVPALEHVLVENTAYLAVTQQGCIALMHLVKISAASRAKVLAVVTPGAHPLAHDAYGNYVLQSLVEYGDEDGVCSLLKSLKGKMGAMATNKFASNVLEKAIKSEHANVRRLVVAELIFHADSTLRVAVHDQFGNFVVQAALATSSSVAEHRRICDRIRPMLAGSPFAAKIELRMRTRRPTTGSSPASASFCTALSPSLAREKSEVAQPQVAAGECCSSSHLNTVTPMRTMQRQH